MKSTTRIAVAFALLSTGAARAQDWTSGPQRPNEMLWGFNWEIAQPVSSFRSYVDNLSLRGFSVEGRTFLRENLSLGTSFSWNRFAQTRSGSTEIPNGMVTGRVFRYADMLGLRALAHYYLNSGPVKPYLGAGIGGVWGYADQQVADIFTSQAHFAFIASPEIGVMYLVPRGGAELGVNVALRYTYTTVTVGTQKDSQTISAVLGLVFGR